MTDFLVTGASGSLGGAVVRRLVADGRRVRAMVRRAPDRPIEGVEYALADLGDADAVDRAVRGAERVIHAGATMKGDWAAHLAGTVNGTRHVVDACLRHGVAQLIHISSMSVIDWAGSSDGAPVSEATALEPRAAERGPYTRAKLEAERIVAEAVVSRKLPAVILRPGQIFGGGIPLINGAVARRAGGRWLVLGDGKLTLPLVYLGDVIDAIVAASERALTHGEIIQLVGRELLTQEEVLALAGAGLPVTRVPRAIVFALGKLSELPLALLRRPSPIAAYRMRSALARLRFESDRAEELLGWVPKVGARELIRRGDVFAMSETKPNLHLRSIVRADFRRLPSDDAALLPVLEQMYADEQRAGGTSIGIYLAAVALLTYGRLDVIGDLLEHMPAPRHPANRAMAGAIDRMFPLPADLHSGTAPAEVLAWIRANPLRWDEDAGRFVRDV